MWNWIERLAELQKREISLVLVTVIGSKGSTPRDIGAKMIVLGGGEIFGTIGGGALEFWAIAEAKKCLAEGTSKTLECDLSKDVKMPCGGQVEFLMEVINKRPRLYVFGGGHVGQAVCRVFSGTPFLIHVIDEREEWISADRFPEGVIRHHAPWAKFVQDAQWDEAETYAVILTHSSELDQEILKEVIQLPARYVGMIGSRGKWEKTKRYLAAEGISEKDLTRVRCPLGVPVIKGKSPQEIAISLAAELLAIHDGK